MIGFNPSNSDATLYVAPMYGDIPICPYVGYWIVSYARLLKFVRFLLRTNTLYRIICVCCFTIFIFKLVIFVY